MKNHTDIHLFLIDYVEKCAKEYQWDSAEIYNPGNNHTYGKFYRFRESWSDYNNSQYLKYVIKDGHVNLLKTSSDGGYYDEAEIINLVHPNSLEKIRRYFVY
jgi:hypothetical protein